MERTVVGTCNNCCEVELINLYFKYSISFVIINISEDRRLQRRTTIFKRVTPTKQIPTCDTISVSPLPHMLESKKEENNITKIEEIVLSAEQRHRKLCTNTQKR